MEKDKEQVLVGIPSFLKKVIQDKKDIKEALQQKKPLNDLVKEKGINFVKPL